MMAATAVSRNTTSTCQRSAVDRFVDTIDRLQPSSGRASRGRRRVGGVHEDKQLRVIRQLVI